MTAIGIIGNGPQNYPDFAPFKEEIDFWIAADRGALALLAHNIPIDLAVGDFDSITADEKEHVRLHAKQFEEYPAEKDETDLEIALLKALEKHPERLYLFGVTGGRLDHEMINIQLLHTITENGVHGMIVDQSNLVELYKPGEYTVESSALYTNISFIPFSPTIKGLTLTGFYYPLSDKTVTWGSTLCISNRLIRNIGTFSFAEGILLLIKSRDTIQR
ncbi:Thiamine pyrophosphokinase [Oceanobacillus picturae]|jgi:thiamine pyrophosphokinase|uniref:Thiamine diphosphokinase n=1 Tax=Oceanobacillus picturae TaxID=171693 RepID=W9A941_9BACI|nr:thiamine diphosphokinase [Oceanobacillus picturae]RIU96412.1 thiamine diphosphokinase [Oceanobacillus picturae]CDO02279.1 Thiamine pyrophosphokinase [Oceanobacillus picturae]